MERYRIIKKTDFTGHIAYFPQKLVFKGFLRKTFEYEPIYNYFGAYSFQTLNEAKEFLENFEGKVVS